MTFGPGLHIIPWIDPLAISFSGKLTTAVHIPPHIRNNSWPVVTLSVQQEVEETRSSLESTPVVPLFLHVFLH
jgi:hypothetical protein